MVLNIRFFATSIIFLTLFSINVSAQSPTTFLPGSTISSSSVNNAFASKLDLVNGVQRIATNSLLQSFAVSGITSGTPIYRQGFYAPGDGGNSIYIFSSANCVSADNGLQVQPTSGTGCWIANLAGVQPSPKIWGARGDGVTDDTSTMQAAMTAMANKTLYFGPYTYLLNSGVVVPAGERISGSANVGRLITPSTAGGPPATFKAGSINLNLITFNSGSYLDHVSIDMQSIGRSTSGAAILIGANAQDVLIEDISIQGGYLQIDLNGNVNSVKNSFLNNAYFGGIRIGHQTTAGATVDPRIEGVTIATAPTASYGMLIEDAGGAFLTNNDILFAAVGTKLFPGANQNIDWLFASNTVLGDTSNGNGTGIGFLIDTGAASARIRQMQITNGWVGSHNIGVDIKNTGLAFVNGIHFVGFRAISGTGVGNAFNIEAGTNVTIDNSEICWQQGNTGVYVSSGVSGGAIRGTLISSTCGDSGTFQPVVSGITFLGANSDWIVTQNELSQGVTTPLNITAGALTGTSIFVSNNLGVDGVMPVVASASSITLSANPSIMVSGTTAITQILGEWSRRSISIIPTDPTGISLVGAVAGTGKICASKNIAQYSEYTLRWNDTLSCWSGA